LIFFFFFFYKICSAMGDGFGLCAVVMAVCGGGSCGLLIWAIDRVVDLGCARLLIWAVDRVVEVVVDRLVGF
jgi:hypothetical protein